MKLFQDELILISFHKYLAVDIALGAYLGVWNATVPVIIIRRGNTADLAIYEALLAAAALIATPLLAALIERIARQRAMAACCAIIFLMSALRFILLQFVFSMVFLTAIDLIAVCAFAGIQPLMGVYPAEAAHRAGASAAFRTQRLAAILVRVFSPLAAGLAIAAASLAAALALSVLCGGIAVGTVLVGRTPTTPPQPVPRRARSLLRELGTGLRIKMRIPPERFLSAVSLLLTLCMAATLPLVVPALIRQNHLPDSTAGMANAAFSAGAIGALLLMKIAAGDHVRWKSRFVCLWLLLFVALCALILSAGVISMTCACTVTGLASGCLALLGLEKRMLAVPACARVRLAGATIMLGQAAGSIAFLACGAAIEHWGMDALRIGYGVAALVSIGCALSSRDIWDMLGTRDDGLGAFYGNRYAQAAEACFDRQR
ncbi:MAG: hypothetical protein ACRYG5_15105 [Janthinobacterium lividum]